MRHAFKSLFAIALCASPALADGSSLLFHNGSQMRFELASGQVEIRYAIPKASLGRAGVGPGALLFHGALGRDGRLTGQAFTFKKNCAPAPYVVNGAVNGSAIVLRGYAPHRAAIGCGILAYSETSRNATLVFDGLDPTVLVVSSDERHAKSRYAGWEAAAEPLAPSTAPVAAGPARQPVEKAIPAQSAMSSASIAPVASPVAKPSVSPSSATEPLLANRAAVPKPAVDALTTEAPKLQEPPPQPLADVNFPALIGGYVRAFPESKIQQSLCRNHLDGDALQRIPAGAKQ